MNISLVLTRWQREFCPPLDTSLLAALVSDLELNQHDDNPSKSTLSVDIQSLRANLRKLAAEASVQVEQQLNDELAAVHLSQSYASTTDSTPEFYSGETTNSSSKSSESSQYSFSSPLGFLQAALPHISVSRLSEAINDAGGNMDDDNIELVVEALLTSEHIKELEERGIEEFDYDEETPTSESMSLETVGAKKKLRSMSSVSKGPKRKQPKSRPIPLVDIRQKQHARSNSSNSLPSPEPWIQMSSLASYIADMIRSHEASFFLSHFHNPEYDSPSTALRAALTSIFKSTSSSQFIPSPQERTAILFGLLDVLCASPVYETLSPDRKSLLISDTQLALTVASGREDDALGLIWLLHDLDADEESGNWKMGMYHTPSPPSTPSVAWFNLSTTNSPAHPSGLAMPISPIQHVPSSRTVTLSKSCTPSRTSSSCQWQSVPVREPPKTYPHALYIPSSSQSRNNPQRRAVGGNALGKGGKGDVGELGRRNMKESMRKRDELVRQAVGLWKKGSAKNRGGEVAAYFAERAREAGEEIRMKQLENARVMVENKRCDTSLSIGRPDLICDITGDCRLIIATLLICMEHV